GIPGSATEHHTAPYSLTEEFVSVYRMHPLLPDDFVLHSSPPEPSWAATSPRRCQVSEAVRSSDGSSSPISSTRWASHILVRSGCTTTRDISKISSRTAVNASTWRWSTQ